MTFYDMEDQRHRGPVEELLLCFVMTAGLLCLAFLLNTICCVALIGFGLYCESDLLYAFLIVTSLCVVPAVNEESIKLLALRINGKVMLVMFPVALSMAEVFFVYSDESAIHSIYRTFFHLLTTAVLYVGVRSDSKKMKWGTYIMAIVMHFVNNFNALGSI